jgi:hypothetical protein
MALGTRMSVSLNKEKVSRAISENKIAVCEKTQGLRRGNFSDLNSACSTVLVPVKIFQFQDMHYENRFLGTFQGHIFKGLLAPPLWNPKSITPSALSSLLRCFGGTIVRASIVHVWDDGFDPHIALMTLVWKELVNTLPKVWFPTTGNVDRVGISPMCLVSGQM